MLVLLLAACDLFNPESVGAYTCDAYCEQVVGKTDECAQQQFDAACAGDSACGEYSESDLGAYAGQGRDDWADAGKDEMVASCNDDLASAGKTDTECQAETAVLNNLSCDDILSLLGDMQSAAN
jgi:hypothetical protein